MKEIPNHFANIDGREVEPHRKRIFVEGNGNVINPLCKYPRNSTCFCGSGVKAKKCCLPQVKPYTTHTMAEQLADYMRRYNEGEPVILQIKEA